MDDEKRCEIVAQLTPGWSLRIPCLCLSPLLYFSCVALFFVLIYPPKMAPSDELFSTGDALVVPRVVGKGVSSFIFDQVSIDAFTQTDTFA